MEQPNLRAGDADRQRIVAELQRHYVDGRLDQDELDQRVKLALEARTFGQLDRLLRDLPSGEREAEPAPDLARRSRPGPWANHDFRKNLISYILVMAMLVTIWGITSPGGYFWPVWPMLGWGIGILFHALQSLDWFGPAPGSGSSDSTERDRPSDR